MIEALRHMEELTFCEGSDEECESLMELDETTTASAG
jgi:hypothetical protein